MQLYYEYYNKIKINYLSYPIHERNKIIGKLWKIKKQEILSDKCKKIICDYLGIYNKNICIDEDDIHYEREDEVYEKDDDDINEDINYEKDDDSNESEDEINDGADKYETIINFYEDKYKNIYKKNKMNKKEYLSRVK
jgi:hypothetical protein